MKNKVLHLCFCLLLFPFGDVQAQFQNTGISFTPQSGFLLPHRATMSHLNTGHVYGGELSFAYQYKGDLQWHHDFFFPKLELGAFYYDLGNKEVLGNTFGISANLYLPYFRNKGWSFGNALGFGLAYVSKTYDLQSNPKNNAIGSHMNTVANVGFRLSKQFVNSEIDFELSMLHLSNGALQLPNLGLNLPLIGIGYTHYLNDLEYQEIADNHEARFPLKTWSFSTQFIASAKQIYPTGGSTYGVVALTNYAQFRTNTKCIIEGGVDAIYNQSVVKYADGEHNRIKNFQLGIYAAYVLPMHNFHLMVAMGGYVIDPLDPGGPIYHKLGGRFKITEKLWGNFSIKSHWAKADYFEYGISYRWK